MEEVIEINGPKEGPTSIILVGVHGNEKCGVEALKEILSTLRIESGRVFIAYGNPRAIEQGVRFTEANLNRMFKADVSNVDKESYEYARAQYLKQYLAKSDALLDVHASTTPKSCRFIICEQNAYAIVKSLPVNLVVSGFDQIQPGGTDYYMNSNSKIGICMECGYLGDPLSSAFAKQGIIAFLSVRGHILGEIKDSAQRIVHIYAMHLTKTDRFVPAKEFADFEDVLAGQIIGTDGEEDVCAPKDGIVLFVRKREKAGDEAFLLGEYLVNGVSHH